MGGMLGGLGTKAHSAGCVLLGFCRAGTCFMTALGAAFLGVPCDPEVLPVLSEDTASGQSP